MKDGFIKIAAITPKIKVADCDFNSSEIISCIEEAAKNNAQIAVFSELSVTAYTCGDLFNQSLLLDEAEKAISKIEKSCADKNMIVVVGAPLRFQDKLYNCAVVIYKGKILGVIPKTNVPNYAEFYELRNFAAAPEGNYILNLNGEDVPFGNELVFKCMNMKNFTFGVEICEDLWVPNSPSVSHGAAGAHIICNLSASDETLGKSAYRRMLVNTQSAKLNCAYVYTDTGIFESTTDAVFSGHKIISENGSIIAESGLYASDSEIIYGVVDVNKLASERQRITTNPSIVNDYYDYIGFEMPLSEVSLENAKIERNPFIPEDKDFESILNIQAYALKRRMEHIHANSAVIGVSGGLDSCLALLVTHRTFKLMNIPVDNIHALSMPCFGTSNRTKSNSEIICNALGCNFREVDITASVLQHFKDLNHKEDVYDAAFENAQARERTQILMDLANMTNGLVVGTGDLSELALGWATFNGDHMAMYGVNAGIPKTLIQHIVRDYANKSDSEELKKVLLDILDTPISPELIPSESRKEMNHKTEDLVGPYELHDFFLYYMLRYSFAPSKIYRLAVSVFENDYDRETVLKWLRVFYRRFFAMQFKRSTLPDGPKVGDITLSPRSDWKMPSDAYANIWLKEIDSIQL